MMFGVNRDVIRAELGAKWSAVLNQSWIDILDELHRIGRRADGCSDRPAQQGAKIA